MDILHTSYYLQQKPGSFLLWESFLLYYVLKELSTSSVLHDEKQLFVRFDYLYESLAAYLIQLDYVGMTHYLQNVDFSCHSIDIRDVDYFVFDEHLDGHTLSSQAVEAYMHFPKSSFSQATAFVKHSTYPGGSCL